MRNDIPQIETREIADTDLDAISGGVGIAAEGVGSIAGQSVGGGAALGVESAAVDSVAGTATGALGTVTGMAGL